MKIIICPDSFKGSLSASEVAKTISDTLIEINPAFDIIQLPLADGGEGTVEIIKNQYPFSKSNFFSDPLGRSISVDYYITSSGDKAFIESAKVIGLPLLSTKERNPLFTSSYGLGQVIKNAIQSGIKEISISLGGSATCDAGMGMLHALGYNFLDRNGNILMPNGENLSKIFKIEESPLADKIKTIKFTAICDVNNPLFGPNGAAHVYAPQKGALKEDVDILDIGLQNFAQIVSKQDFCDINMAFINGAGAAGGLGFALKVFLNALLIPGIEHILQAVNFDSLIKDSQLIITGEGKIDSQSLMGKVISGVLKHASQQNIPVLAVTGIMEDEDNLRKAGLTKVYKISDPSLSLEQNMLPSQAICNLRKIFLSLFPSLSYL